MRREIWTHTGGEKNEAYDVEDSVEHGYCPGKTHLRKCMKGQIHGYAGRSWTARMESSDLSRWGVMLRTRGTINGVINDERTRATGTEFTKFIYLGYVLSARLQPGARTYRSWICLRWQHCGRKTEGHVVGYESDAEWMEVPLGLRISSLSTLSVIRVQVSCVDLKKMGILKAPCVKFKGLFLPVA